MLGLIEARVAVNRCNGRDRFYKLITPTVFIFPFQNFACILKKLQKKLYLEIFKYHIEKKYVSIIFKQKGKKKCFVEKKILTVNLPWNDPYIYSMTILIYCFQRTIYHFNIVFETIYDLGICLCILVLLYVFFNAMSLHYCYALWLALVMSI